MAAKLFRTCLLPGSGGRAGTVVTARAPRTPVALRGLLEELRGGDPGLDHAVAEQHHDQRPRQGQPYRRGPHATASFRFSGAGSWNRSGTARTSRLATKPTASTPTMVNSAGWYADA